MSLAVLSCKLLLRRRLVHYYTILLRLGLGRRRHLCPSQKYLAEQGPGRIPRVDSEILSLFDFPQTLMVFLLLHGWLLKPEQL